VNPGLSFLGHFGPYERDYIPTGWFQGLKPLVEIHRSSLRGRSFGSQTFFETQLIGALPKMAEAASSQELASAFEHHLGETRGHISRLESIFKQIGEKSSGETCEAMKGLLKEGEILVKAEGDPDVRDAGLIGAAQRVEHYEMAGYGTARSLAQQLGENQMAEILQETLNEEGEANKKLTSIAERQVNVAAAS
jgi:ferritin-like metal-binding protein YciE